MQRQAAVAGQFYAADGGQLRSDLAALLPEVRGSKKVTGIIAPHAGYVYSGAIAGQVYASIAIPATVLILGPNHHGSGAGAALYPDGEWMTPLGPVVINAR
ncbi:MAG: AmmeMemoRadiSam system protein B, partial [Desulfobacteraceae bacterium]|nr:AmmeMemoRadiSam system protein B [Desulfobacteraceae bacterium]